MSEKCEKESSLPVSCFPFGLSPIPELSSELSSEVSSLYSVSPTQFRARTASCSSIMYSGSCSSVKSDRTVRNDDNQDTDQDQEDEEDEWSANEEDDDCDSSCLVVQVRSPTPLAPTPEPQLVIREEPGTLMSELSSEKLLALDNKELLSSSELLKQLHSRGQVPNDLARILCFMEEQLRNEVDNKQNQLMLEHQPEDSMPHHNALRSSASSEELSMLSRILVTLLHSCRTETASKGLQQVIAQFHREALEHNRSEEESDEGLEDNTLDSSKVGSSDTCNDSLTSPNSNRSDHKSEPSLNHVDNACNGEAVVDDALLSHLEETFAVLKGAFTIITGNQTDTKTDSKSTVNTNPNNEEHSEEQQVEIVDNSALIFTNNDVDVSKEHVMESVDVEKVVVAERSRKRRGESRPSSRGSRPSSSRAGMATPLGVAEEDEWGDDWEWEYYDDEEELEELRNLDSLNTASTTRATSPFPVHEFQSRETDLPKNLIQSFLRASLHLEEHEEEVVLGQEKISEPDLSPHLISRHDTPNLPVHFCADLDMVEVHLTAEILNEDPEKVAAFLRHQAMVSNKGKKGHKKKCSKKKRRIEVDEEGKFLPKTGVKQLATQLEPKLKMGLEEEWELSKKEKRKSVKDLVKIINARAVSEEPQTLNRDSNSPRIAKNNNIAHSETSSHNNVNEKGDLDAHSPIQSDGNTGADKSGAKKEVVRAIVRPVPNSNQMEVIQGSTTTVVTMRKKRRENRPASIAVATITRTISAPAKDKEELNNDDVNFGDRGDVLSDNTSNTTSANISATTTTIPSPPHPLATSSSSIPPPPPPPATSSSSIPLPPPPPPPGTSSFSIPPPPPPPATSSSSIPPPPPPPPSTSSKPAAASSASIPPPPPPPSTSRPAPAPPSRPRRQKATSSATLTSAPPRSTSNNNSNSSRVEGSPVPTTSSAGTCDSRLSPSSKLPTVNVEVPKRHSRLFRLLHDSESDSNTTTPEPISASDPVRSRSAFTQTDASTPESSEIKSNNREISGRLARSGSRVWSYLQDEFSDNLSNHDNPADVGETRRGRSREGSVLRTSKLIESSLKLRLPEQK